jgi:LacI family transcriptional regulator
LLSGCVKIKPSESEVPEMSYKIIAKAADTTVSTVSKAFHNSNEISKAKKEKIYEVARELGLYEKYYRGEKGKTLVGIICPEPESETYGMLVGYIEKGLYERGAETLVGISRFDSKRKSELYSELIYRAKADGIIVLGSKQGLKNPDNVPTVSILEGDYSESAVSVNIKETMEQLFLLLKNENYRRVGFIGERLTVGRLQAFKSAMRKEGLPLLSEYIYIAESARFAEAGVEGMEAFIKNGNIPEVIITAYDNIAFGAMKAAKEHGLKIPDDISFIGINDITTSEYMDVPLSSIETNYSEVSRTAVNLIISQIESKNVAVKKKSPMIPAKLNLRKSVKRNSGECK